MRTSLVSPLLVAVSALLGACTSDSHSAYTYAAVADDGATLIVTVIREESRTTKIVYEHTRGTGFEAEAWFVPLQGRAAGSPRLLRTFQNGNPFPDEVYGMLTGGYVYFRTLGEGRYLLDIATNETRQITGPDESQYDVYVPSRDGRHLAHFARESPYHCEYSITPCTITINFIETATLERVSSVELSFPAPDISADAFYPPFRQRFAWTAAGTLRFTNVTTLDVTVAGEAREVPFEPCYYAATSSGPVSLAGEVFEQAVTPEGAFTSITMTNVFAPTDGEPTRCVLPRE